MKRIALILLPLFVFLSTGCFEILEEITLGKDGKGKYLYTVDMSALMDESMKEMLQGAGDEGGNSLVGVEVDSVVYFKDFPAEKLAELENPRVFERGFMKILMSDSLDKMVIQFGTEFDKIEEVTYFLENLDMVTGDAVGGGEIPMGQGLFPGGNTAGKLVLKGRKLTRTSIPKVEIEADEDEMGMMSLFMESATFTTVYNLPGKVKKTSIPGAVIEGKTVKVESPLLDMLKGDANTGGWIKFRGK